MVKQREESTADTLLEDAKNLLEGIQEFKSKKEYSTINMNLKTVCKELNELVIKGITKEEDNPKPSDLEQEPGSKKGSS